LAQLINPTEIAKDYRRTLRQRLAGLGAKLKLVGVLAAEAGDHAPSVTYADYTRAACDDVGIAFELRRPGRLKLEEELDAANADKSVHGIIVYYPVFGTEHDGYIKDAVDLTKDIEGLNGYWARKLYHNQRWCDPEKTKKAILPCTPLAIVKLLEAADGPKRQPGREPLAGRTIAVFNRSEVVGRPLACMLANDGADVYSFDVTGPLLFKKEHVVETDATRAEALARYDVVITGVPSREFRLVGAGEIRAGATCINFSTLRNFAPDIEGKAGVFIQRVGPMPVTMALRNVLRLYENFHA
jgi:methylenetetrahydrofolate dehydrogenase (NADP+)/methenyltetrahydrofolate cyclohydrolase